MLEEPWRRLKKLSATSSKHLSEELLLLPVVLCLEDLKSISITERSCRELHNNHLQIWQSKVRILMLQFISFDMLSVIFPLPAQPFYTERETAHHLFPRRLRKTAISLPFLPLPLCLFLSLPCCFSLPGFFWLFLPSLNASFMALSKEKEESYLLQPDTK